MITTTWRCKSLRLIGGRSPERLTPGDPAILRALDNEELFVVEGSQKIHWRNAPTAKKTPKIQGARRKNCPDFNVKLQPRQLLCTLLSVCMPSWRRSLGTQREVQFHQQNQQNACHCHGDDESGHFLFGHVSRKKRESI